MFWSVRQGKRGVVQQCIEDRVVVAGVNVAKKTTKPNPMTGATGGIVDKLMPIHVSNVALFNAKRARLIAWVLRKWTARRSVSLNRMVKLSGLNNYGASTGFI